MDAKRETESPTIDVCGSVDEVPPPTLSAPVADASTIASAKARQQLSNDITPSTPIGTSIHVHAKFNSFAEFEAAFEEWKKREHHPFRVASSETLKMPSGDTNDTFKYRYIVYHCAHYGTPRMRGAGKRPNQSYLPCGCKAMLRLNYSWGDNVLRITTLHAEHTGHELSTEAFGRFSTKVRRSINGRAVRHDTSNSEGSHSSSAQQSPLQSPTDKENVAPQTAALGEYSAPRIVQHVPLLRNTALLQPWMAQQMALQGNKVHAMNVQPPQRIIHIGGSQTTAFTSVKEEAHSPRPATEAKTNNALALVAAIAAQQRQMQNSAPTTNAPAHPKKPLALASQATSNTEPIDLSLPRRADNGGSRRQLELQSLLSELLASLSTCTDTEYEQRRAQLQELVKRWQFPPVAIAELLRQPYKRASPLRPVN